MIKQATTTLIITLAFGCTTTQSADELPVAKLSQDRDVVFSRDVAPVLNKNCIACHNASNEEGGVNLETVQRMIASDVEDVLVPGKPDSSRLFVLASHADDPIMPPDDNDVSAAALDPTELALLRRWIQSGAVVDQMATSPSEQTWQPLPPELRTVYGSAMTADGRLSAISFANQISVFGSGSPEPIGRLEIDAGDQTRPAHDDFVQDLVLSPNGRLIASAGFRNVKLWKMAPLEPTTIPRISHDDSLAIGMNPSGTHLAALSRRGELSVAEVGTNRWQWMKSFDVPDALTNSDPPRIHLALGTNAHQAAVAWGNTIRMVRIDAAETETIDSPSMITALLWYDTERLATADAKGKVIFWRRDEAGWSRTAHDVFDQPVKGLYATAGDPMRLVAVDVAGKVATWNKASRTFVDAGQIPTPVSAAALSFSDESLWIATTGGGLGRYDIVAKQFIEVAKSDPVAEARYARDNWQSLVGERLVATHEKSVKQAETNVAAETKSVEALAKEIESKTKQKSDKLASLTDAKQAADAASTKLDKAKSDEQTQNQLRKDLAEAAKQLESEISKLESKLAELRKEHSDTKTRLSEIPDAKKLTDVVKAATEAVAKANKTTAERQSELKAVESDLRLAEQTKARGESRLEGLHAELESQKQLLGEVKANQETRKANANTAKSLSERSHATDQTLAVLAAGNRIVTRASASEGKAAGSWSVWSGDGVWLAELAEMPTDGELVAAGDHCVLIKTADGDTHALRGSTRLWNHQKTIGSSTGNSTFADRVLSVDLHPSGNLLATGGGEPSRSGELMIWKVDDGSLVRSFEKPHDDTVLCVRFSPDGTKLATGGADQMVRLWDVESGKLIKTLEGHTHHVTTIAWNVNRRQLASGSADATVKIWDVDSGQATRTIKGLKTEVTGLVFVGRDNRIGIAGGDSYFRVYRTDNGARETNAKVLGGYLYALDSNRDGSQFVVGGADGVAVVVDKSGKQLLQFDSKAE